MRLRIEVYGDEATVATYQRIADAYTATHPEVTFKLTSMADGGAAAEAAIGSIASDIDPPDLFLLDVDHLADAVQADVLQPVNELLEARGIPFGDGIQRSALAAYSANNELACMPNDVSPIVAFYNHRLVKPGQLVLPSGDKVGPIDKSFSWNAFVAATEAAAAQGATGTYLPPDLRLLTPLILSAGGQVVDDESNPSRLELSSSATHDALKAMAAVSHDPRLSLTPAQVAQNPALEWFEEGKLGVLFGTKAIVPQLRAVKGLRFDVAPVPDMTKTVTTSEMNAYCIAKTSKHVNEAADFIAFATDGDGVATAAASGSMVPSSLDALHSPEFLAAGSLPRNVALFGEAARKSAPTPYSVNWLSVVAAANPVLQRVLYGKALDVTSPDTPELDALLADTDEASKATFNPPKTTPTPSP